MNITLFTSSLSGGGAERVVANLANALSSKNKVQISTLVSNESFYELNDNVDLVSSNFTINRKNAFTTFFCYAKFFLKARSFIKNKATGEDLKELLGLIMDKIKGEKY